MGEEEDAAVDWQVDHLVAKWFRPNFEASQVRIQYFVILGGRHGNMFFPSTAVFSPTGVSLLRL